MLRFFYSATLTLAITASLAAQPIVRRPPRQAVVIERWSGMSPEQRTKALEKLPPERRRRIEEQLNTYQSLSPEQREQLRFRSEMFNQLPPERQDQARRLFRQFNQLPPDRKALLREEFRNLRAMPEADRRARIESDDFRGKFNNREQRFLRAFAGLLTQPEGLLK